MIQWMLYTVLAGAMIAGAAVAAEEGARLLRKPQRWGWLFAMAAAAVLPLLYRLLPARPEPAATTGAVDPDLLAALLLQATAVESPASFADRSLFGRQADAVLIAMWVVAAAAMATALLLTYRRLSRVRACGEAVRIAGVPARLTESTGPMVVGVRRPEVVVPRWIAALSEEEQRLVVRHECEHVRAGDPRLLIAGALLVTAMPWNLPLWWMRRRLRQAIEVDCDARVLATGADRRLYGSMLIRTAGRPRPAPLFAPALVGLPSLLERRILAMTAKSPEHRSVRLGAAVSLAALLFAAACGLTPRASEPAPASVVDAEDATGTPDLAGRAEPSDDEDGGHGLEDPAGELGELSVERIQPGHDTAWTPGRTMVPAAAPAAPVVGYQEVDGVRVPVFSTDLDLPRVPEAVAVEPARSPAAAPKARPAAAPRTSGPAPVVPATGAAEGSVRSPAPAQARGYLRGIVIRGDGAPPAGSAAPVPEEVVAVSYETARRARSVAPVAEEIVAVGYETAQRTRAITPVAEEIVAVGYETAQRTRATEIAIAAGRLSVAESRVEGVAPARVPAASPTQQPLILVDGEVVPTIADVMERFDSDEIASISVIKDPETAVARYGARGRHGAIIITLKK